MKKFFKSIFPFLFKKDDDKVKGHRPPDDNNEQEFTFIWYKKMELGNNKTQYTAKNRTKVRAKNREEAVEKMTKFAMSKMTLVIHEEKDYSASELGQIDEFFEKFNEQMDKMFNKKYRK
jgi:hypothetical protein